MSSKHKLNKLYDEQGNLISPELASDVKNYLVDIDGTITEDVPNEHPERMATCEPYPDALETLNKWYDEGHIITFFTSRTADHKEVTETWLDKHGFRHHGVLYGKPRGGNYHWIDNSIVKATKFKGKFTDMEFVLKHVEIFKK